MYGLCGSLEGLTNSMVVSKGGNLPCQFVFHLAPKNDQKSWKTALEHCFCEAEKLQMASLVLPPVGTGLLPIILFIDVNVFKKLIRAIYLTK